MRYLIIIAIALIGCTKEPLETISPPPVETIGVVTFYVDNSDRDQIDFPITLTVNDSIVEVRLNGASNGPPNCDLPSTLGKKTFNKSGSYTWKAVDESNIWRAQGTVIYEAGVCKTVRM